MTVLAACPVQSSLAQEKTRICAEPLVQRALGFASPTPHIIIDCAFVHVPEPARRY